MQIGNLLNPKNDYVFKRIFGYIGNEEITKGLINAIVDDIQITNIELDCKEILERDLQDDKLGILDVRAVLGNSMQCAIEMQVIDKKNIEDRILYYWSSLYSKSLKRANDYLNTKKTIIILFTEYELDNLKGIENYMSRWHIKEDNYTNYILTEKLDIAIIEIPKYKKYKGKNKRLDAWVKFIDKPEEINMDEIKGDKALQEAKKLLEDISEDEYEQDLAFKRDLFLMDKVAIEAAGYDKGLEEGVRQGIQQEKKEIVKRMLEKNTNIEFIIECTGLTKEQIEKLK